MPSPRVLGPPPTVIHAQPVRYLSREQAAAYTGLGASTLNNLAVSGKGPQYLKVFGRVLYDVADLDAWLLSMKVDPATRLQSATEQPEPSTPAVKRGRGRPRNPTFTERVVA